jgi:hypothetical protein
MGVDTRVRWLLSPNYCDPPDFLKSLERSVRIASADMDCLIILYDVAAGRSAVHALYKKKIRYGTKSRQARVAAGAGLPDGVSAERG